MLPVPACSADQDGVFSRRQALAAGFSYATIRRRLGTGQWRIVIGDVMCASDRAPGARGRLIAAVATTRGTASHWSAALLHGFDAVPVRAGVDPELPHVTTSRRVHVNLAGLVEHRLRLYPEHVVTVDGIAATSPDRTVVDLLAVMPMSPARTLLYRAIQQGWLDRIGLRRHVERRGGWHGTPQLRVLLADLREGAHAVSEARAMEVLLAAGIDVEANVRIALPRGGWAVLDLVVTGTRLVIEIDGRAHHAAPERFIADRERQNQLVAAGFTVLRFTWVDVMERPQHLVRTVREVLGRAA
jgi:hypothetical protein